MSKNTKDKDVEWELSFGFYPGVLIGVRSYPEENHITHVLYLPLIDVALTIYK